MRSCVLRMITSEGNHNKVYIMRQISSSEFIAEYGREGAKLQQKKYSLNRWETLYEQKQLKGYRDVTDYYETVVREKKSQYRDIPDSIVQKLMDSLLAYSNKVIRREYNISLENVSQKMIDDAEEMLQSLLPYRNKDLTSRDIYYIQDVLKNLWLILPRKMSNVEDALYHKGEDFGKFITKEAEILDVMRGRIQSDDASAKVEEEGKPTILEAYGMEVTPITDPKRIDQIKRHLDDYTRARFTEAFRVSNLAADARFYDFMKAKGYGKEDVHWLYHGSRNMNIFGLLSKGFLLNSGAIRTGSMFGNGIYTAPKARKSLGYTSLPESCWNHESDNEGFILLNKVLYKNPKNLWSHSPQCSSFNRKNIGEHDAVFAHKKQGFLFNDEIIVYDERQIIPHTLIRLKN